jgi:rhodanese-related sulfurtransferase
MVTSVAIAEITVDQLKALGDDVVIVDVREPDEWAAGHIPSAVHVPLGEVPDRLDAFDGSPTYVVCKAGGRSFRACELAAADGRSVVNVIGGMLAWSDAGYEIV